MKWESEDYSPASYMSTANWLMEEEEEEEERKKTRWTVEENKMFENALAVFDHDTPDRWLKVAAMIPGKTADDVMTQYRELEADINNIEAGLVPIPGYATTSPPFTLDWVGDNGYQHQNYAFAASKRPSSSLRLPDQERKKGVPWTEEEHKLFLMGLKKYGKGDWRNISRNFVVTRTPTQVASHAQKYFIRQISGGKDKRRASIHDITTVNLNETKVSTPDTTTTIPSPDQANSAPMRHFQWTTQQSKMITMPFNPTQGNFFMTASAYGINSLGQNLVRQSSYMGPQNHVSHMQTSQR